jgi:hypothetical protein
MLKLSYGYPIQGDNDPIFQDIQQISEHSVRAGMFTSKHTETNSEMLLNKLSDFMVNIFPSLSYVPDWFPGTGWKRTAREWKALKERAQSVPYEWTKAQLVRIRTIGVLI